jgi:hypothetical protein
MIFYIVFYFAFINLCSSHVFISKQIADLVTLTCCPESTEQVLRQDKIALASLAFALQHIITSSATRRWQIAWPLLLILIP